MTAVVTLIPNAKAHTPPYNIPTYAYIFASPNPIGVGQTTHVYMWLDMVYGSGGTNVNGGAFPAGQYSTAELSNNYRFLDYQYTVTAPDGTNTTTTFPIVADSTSDQGVSFTPATTGTYTLTFHYPGQVYGANGNGNPLSSLVNDTYRPSTASMTVMGEPLQWSRRALGNAPRGWMIAGYARGRSSVWVRDAAIMGALAACSVRPPSGVPG